ncbi:MAG: hypothetical protein V5804_00075 [Mucilaginibacter sp.]|uniref:hypothetical protein n=1 Tax=Mucilaginibacter sp. TaxID=1882438 RepID=UPI0034E5FC43
MNKADDEKIQRLIEAGCKTQFPSEDELLYEIIFKGLSEEDSELDLKISLPKIVTQTIEIRENRRESAKYTLLLITIILISFSALFIGIAFVNPYLLSSIWLLLKTFSNVVFFAAFGLMLIELFDRFTVKGTLDV